MTMHFGNTLRLLRTEAGISLRELASRIGVSGAYLSRVENGHDPAPTPDRLVAIADVLGLPRSVLVELARQAGPAVDSYLQRTPEAASLFLDIARRELRGPQIARVRAFIADMFPLDGTSDAGKHRLVDRLPASRIVVGVSCSDFEELINIAALRLDEAEAKLVLRRVDERPTALGGGFAVLQAMLGPAADQHESAVMLTLAEPLALSSPDQRPIRVVFLLIRGVDSPSRLELVTRIVRLASYGLADELCAASTPEQAREILERVETAW